MKVFIQFDRGTLLIRNLHKEWMSSFREDHISFPIRWDYQKQAYRIEAYRYQDFILWLQSMQLDYHTNLQSHQTKLQSFDLPNLRVYQSEALSLWETQRKGIISLPTGAGKTLLALTAVKNLKKSTLILVPTRALLEQWHQTINMTYSGACGRIGDGIYELAPITVCTFESAYRRMEHIGHLFQFLIIDEVHHFGNGARDEALVMSVASNRMGLTATLPEKESMSKLHDLIGPVCYTNTLNQLSGTYLAPYQMDKIYLNLSKTEQSYYDLDTKYYKKYFQAFIRHHPQSNWSQFSYFCKKTNDGKKALASFQSSRRLVNFPQAKKLQLEKLLKAHKGQKILIFTGDTNTAMKISQQYFIPVITSAIKKKEREDILKSFSEQKLSCIVSCKVLNEGIDVPSAEVAIIVGGTSNTREFIQRIGRVLRPQPGKKAMIYEFIMNNTHEVNHSQRRNIL